MNEFPPPPPPTDEPPIDVSPRDYVRPHRGTLILVFGILSLFTQCWPLGIVAWVMGNGDLRAIDAGLMDPAGRDTTNIGRICGMIATIILLIGLVIGVCAGVIMLLFAVGAAATGAG